MAELGWALVVADLGWAGLRLRLRLLGLAGVWLVLGSLETRALVAHGPGVWLAGYLAGWLAVWLAGPVGWPRCVAGWQVEGGRLCQPGLRCQGAPEQCGGRSFGPGVAHCTAQQWTAVTY